MERLYIYFANTYDIENMIETPYSICIGRQWELAFKSLNEVCIYNFVSLNSLKSCITQYFQKKLFPLQ